MPTLRSREDFARVSREGRSRSDRLMVIRFVPNARDHDRFGISIGRRLGSAVERNRLRRRVREILRHATEASTPALDMLIVIRPAAASASFPELREALLRLLHAVRGVAEKRP